MGGGKSEAPAAPDMSSYYNLLKEAATEAGAHGDEQLKWARDQFTKNSGNADKFIDSALESQDTLNKQAATDRSTYDNVFTKSLQDQKADADSYASDAKKDEQMGRAQANVAQQFDAARNAATQQLEGYGINPASTRFAALDIGTRAQEAAAKAAAGNQAALDTDNTARTLRQSVIQNSSGLANQATNETNAGANIGAGAVNAGNATTQTGASTMGSAPQYYGIQSNDITGAAGIQNSAYQNQLNQWKADQSASSGVGSAVGTALAIGSKFIGFAEGGAVPAADDVGPGGGAVPVDASPSRGAVTDDIPARLNAGEFVLPRDVTSWLGEQQIQKLIQKARQEKQGAVAKPAIGPAPQQARPQQGAIPMGA